MSRDLHIFADRRDYDRHRITGGGGMCLLLGGDRENFRERLRGLEARDVFLHPGVHLSSEDLGQVMWRQRCAPDCRIYRVERENPEGA